MEVKLVSGLRKKWLATVRQRPNPPGAPPPPTQAQQWDEQWKKLWRDIGDGGSKK